MLSGQLVVHKKIFVPGSECVRKNVSIVIVVVSEFWPPIDVNQGTNQRVEFIFDNDVHNCLAV